MSTLTDAKLRKLPQPIVDKLQSLINRARRLMLIRGLFATLAVALVCILVIMGIDATLTLFSDTIRWALSLTGLAITGLAAWYFLVRPLSRRLTLTRIARVIETRHPELQERISTAVELMNSDDPDSIRGSAELIDEVVNSAVIDVADVSPEKNSHRPEADVQCSWLPASPFSCCCSRRSFRVTSVCYSPAPWRPSSTSAMPTPTR